MSSRGILIAPRSPLPGSASSHLSPSLGFPFNTWRDYNRAMRRRHTIVDAIHTSPIAAAKHISDDNLANLEIAFRATSASALAQDALTYGASFAGTGLTLGAAIGGPYGAVIGAIIGAVIGCVYGVMPWAWFEFESKWEAMISPLDPATRFVLWSHFRRFSNAAREKVGAPPTPAWRLDDGVNIKVAPGGSIQTLAVMNRFSLFCRYESFVKVPMFNAPNWATFEAIDDPMARYMIGVLAMRGEDQQALWDGITIGEGDTLNSGFGGSSSSTSDGVIHVLESARVSTSGGINILQRSNPERLPAFAEWPAYKTFADWVNGPGKSHTVGRIRADLIRPQKSTTQAMPDMDVLPDTPEIRTAITTAQNRINAG